MQHSTFRSLFGWSAAVLSLSCGGAGDDNGLCTTLGPDKPGTDGCVNVVYDLAVHPCQAEVSQACGANAATSSCATEHMATCATSFYLRGYPAETLPACDATKPVLSIDAELNVGLYRYSNISDRNAVRHTQGLQRFYEPLKLMMKTTVVAAPERTRYALAGTEAEMTQALIDAGLDPSATSLTEEQKNLASKVVGNVMFGPTKAFFKLHSLPAESKVNVVIIDQIASPELAAMMNLDGTIVGLGLSSALFANLQDTEPDAASLNTMLQVDGDFTPTLFVGHNDIARLSGNFEIVVAHEMGHALGLPHVTDEGNLMQQGGSHTCRRWLSQNQIDMMGPFADMTLTPDDALTKILASRRTVVEHLIAKRRAAAAKAQ